MNARHRRPQVLRTVKLTSEPLNRYDAEQDHPDDFEKFRVSDICKEFEISHHKVLEIIKKRGLTWYRGCIFATRDEVDDLVRVLTTEPEEFFDNEVCRFKRANKLYIVRIIHEYNTAYYEVYRTGLLLCRIDTDYLRCWGTKRVDNNIYIAWLREDEDVCMFCYEE